MSLRRAAGLVVVAAGAAVAFALLRGSDGSPVEPIEDGDPSAPAAGALGPQARREPELEADREDALADLAAEVGDGVDVEDVDPEARRRLADRLARAVDPDERLAIVSEIVRSGEPIEQLLAIPVLVELDRAAATAVGERWLEEWRGGKRLALFVADVARRLEARGDSGLLDAYRAEQRTRLRTADAKGRARALFELGITRSAAVVPDVVPSLAEPIEEVRTAALRALITSGDASAIPALQALRDDPSSEVRELAARALGVIARR